MYSRKVIISVSGVVLFLLAGASAMFFTSSESPGKVTSSVSVRQAVSTSTSSPTQEAPSAQQSTSKPKLWYVYVTGAVNNPGVYALSADSRVFQAVEAAGGFTKKADRASLNLAEVLADEAHVHVSAIDEQTAAKAPEVVRIPSYSTQTRPASQNRIASRTGTNSGLIDINRADEQELQRINGVGPAIAQRIIDYRNQHGTFTRIDDLINVKGIGQAKLNQIRSQVTLKGSSSYAPTPRSAGSYTTPRPINQAGTNSNLIDINHANSQELQRIKGVGQAIAQRIIDYRNKHGAFTRPEDLLNVRGIGAAKLKDIRTQIVIR